MGDIPAPDHKTVREATSNRFSSKKLGAENICKYTFIIVNVHCKKLPLKKFKQKESNHRNPSKGQRMIIYRKSWFC